jgi:hypothetical protein
MRYGVVMHQDRGVMIANLRYRRGYAFRQIEFTALPVAGQVLRSFSDRAVRPNHTRTSDPDEGSEL